MSVTNKTWVTIDEKLQIVSLGTDQIGKNQNASPVILLLPHGQAPTRFEPILLPFVDSNRYEVFVSTLNTLEKQIDLDVLKTITSKYKNPGVLFLVREASRDLHSILEHNELKQQFHTVILLNPVPFQKKSFSKQLLLTEDSPEVIVYHSYGQKGLTGAINIPIPEASEDFYSSDMLLEAIQNLFQGYWIVKVLLQRIVMKHSYDIFNNGQFYFKVEGIRYPIGTINLKVNNEFKPTPKLIMFASLEPLERKQFNLTIAMREEDRFNPDDIVFDKLLRLKLDNVEPVRDNVYEQEFSLKDTYGSEINVVVQAKKFSL